MFAEQLQRLYSNLWVSIPANLVCAILVFFNLRPTHSGVTAWFVAVFLVTLFRISMMFFYYSQPTRRNHALNLFILGALASAATWGTCVVFLLPFGDISQQMVIILIIAGISVGGSQTLQANVVANVLYIALMIVPLCIWLLMQHEPAHFNVGLAMLVYLSFMAVTALRGNHQLKQSLQLSFANIALVEDLFNSNKKLLHAKHTIEKNQLEMGFINKLSEKLQVCQESQEAYVIIKQTAQTLFPKSNGGLVITMDPSTTMMETRVQWGSQPTLKDKFLWNDCWALRKGNTHLVIDPHKNLICSHFQSPPSSSYLCVPQMARTGVLGLITLVAPEGEDITPHQQKLLEGFNDVVKLSLTNIRLLEMLQEQSIHDPLTQLYNRRFLDETLSRALRTVIRENSHLCVAMIDIDWFKQFNDTNGHEAGDEVLKVIASILFEYFREVDIACRFGGEEFVVILANADMHGAYQRLDALHDTIQKARVTLRGVTLPPIAVSIGVAEAPTHGVTREEILRAADQALYLAKQKGRGRTELFDSDLVGAGEAV